MKEAIIVADAVNAKIDRIIETVKSIEGLMNLTDLVSILEAIKIWDIRINTDGEVYVAFKDKEIMRFKIERDVIK